MKTPIKHSAIPENRIAKLAQHGMLALAGRKAMKATLNKGVSVLVIQEGSIYRVMPDGSKLFVKSVPPNNGNYRIGKIKIS